MKIDSREFDLVLRQDIAWHRSVKPDVSGYSSAERRAFLQGMRQARTLLRKFVSVQHNLKPQA